MIIRTEVSSYMDVIHLMNGQRHGPEFAWYGYFYNRMWTNGGQTGA